MFFRENVYPFDLAPYITHGITLPSFAENYLVPGYLIFSTNPGDVTDRAAWKDVLFFNPNELAGTASSRVSEFSARPPSADLKWSGSGGTGGHVRLTLLSARLLRVEWSADQPGEEQSLISGTATLLRRELH